MRETEEATEGMEQKEGSRATRYPSGLARKRCFQALGEEISLREEKPFKGVEERGCS